MKASNVDRLGVMRRCPLILSMSSAGPETVSVDEEVRRADHASRAWPSSQSACTDSTAFRPGGRPKEAAVAVKLILLRESRPSSNPSRNARSRVAVGCPGRRRPQPGQAREETMTETHRRRRLRTVGRDLAAEHVDLFGYQAGVKIGKVHELEQPRADSQADIYSPERALLDQPPQPDVRERAPHVHEHLDGLHVKMICPPAAFS